MAKVMHISIANTSKWRQLIQTLPSPSNMISHFCIRLAYLELTLDCSNGQLGRWNSVTPNMLAFLLKTYRSGKEISIGEIVPIILITT